MEHRTHPYADYSLKHDPILPDFTRFRNGKG